MLDKVGLDWNKRDDFWLDLRHHELRRDRVSNRIENLIYVYTGSQLGFAEATGPDR